MTDIFISYAKEDVQRIEPLAHALELQGWEVFWDRKIPGGVSWREFIGSALDAAKCVVVAWSTSSIASEWVNDEADRGKDRGILVPLVLDAVRPPLGFGGIQAIDLTRWQGDAAAPEFDRLLRDIARVSGLRAAPGPKPREAAAPGERPRGKPAVGPRHRIRPVLGLLAAAGGLAITAYVATPRDRQEYRSQTRYLVADSSRPDSRRPDAPPAAAAAEAAPSRPEASRPVAAQPPARDTRTFVKIGPDFEEVDDPRNPRGTVGVIFDSLNTSGGGEIGFVRPGGPADRAGLRAGDVVTAIDGRTVRSGVEAQRLIYAADPGAQLELQVERGGKRRTYAMRVDRMGREDLGAFMSHITDKYNGQARGIIDSMGR